jgi:hypothetical protein
MIFQMTCGARWNGDKLMLDKHGHIFSVHTLTDAVKEDLNRVKGFYESDSEYRTVKVIELADCLENELDA